MIPQLNPTTRFLLLLLLGVFQPSCKKENAGDCFKSTGKTISQIRETGPFRRILIKDNVNVTIFKGAEFRVEVIAGQNITRNIKTIVTGDELLVENINRCNFVRGYKRKIFVNITLPDLEMVTNNSVATLRFDENYEDDTLVVRNESSGDSYVNGKFNEIRTSTNGNGDIYLSGTANTFYVYTDGTNYLRAENLLVKNNAFIQTSAIGDCHVNASRLMVLAYKIQSTGNIYYSGEPGRIENIGSVEGQGQLIKE
jgi:hypothetical protein